MQQFRDSIGVRKIEQLEQVCVLVMTAGDHTHAVAAALDYAITGTTKIVVVDCLGLDELPEAVSDQFILAMCWLKAHDRHLIVINVPEPALRDLRAAGVDVEPTTEFMPPCASVPTTV